MLRRSFATRITKSGPFHAWFFALSVLVGCSGSSSPSSGENPADDGAGPGDNGSGAGVGNDSAGGGGADGSGNGSGGGGGPGGGDSSGQTDGAGDGSDEGGGGGASDGLAPPEFAAGELDAPSMGATITMQNIGGAGWYPSRRDPATGECDAVNNGQCCMTKYERGDDPLAPWDEDLIMTLRGPMLVKQFAAYQPDGGAWRRVSFWDERGMSEGIHFDGNGTETSGFPGHVGTECLVDVMPNRPFPCGPGSEPFCPSDTREAYYGWEGSKLFVLLAFMPHVDDPAYSEVKHCSNGPGDGWYDAPWIGLSHGELVRSGKFSGCHCYAKDPNKWQVADGCGQFNVFEVVNDNNEYRNLDLFSTNLFGYHGYVGEGPCGQGCDVSALGSEVDLVNKSTSTAATQGAIITPTQGPGAAFRRPVRGYRYFIILLDVPSRSIQLALVHPNAIPQALSGVLPSLPARVSAEDIARVLALRLPN